ncbi:MAG: glycosyltransferase family 39 protein, partial [Rhodospirillales bacterium]|nr:glycosyltransferase family 39 protein [Rhodospirillales bacterium]
MEVEDRAPPAPAGRPGIFGLETRSEPSLLQILAILATFVAVWALYYTITEAPVAIKHDMAEAYAWGRQFELGYRQHPPFWAWICGLWFRVLPRTGWAFALLSSLNAGVGLWGAWMAIGDFAAGRTRMAAWALLLLTPLYTFYAYKYDANIIFISIWPWTLHSFMRAIKGRRIGAALAFGLCAGLALMSKYYALILLASCFLAALQHPGARKYFTSAAPYVSALTAAAIVSPHIWWLATHRAPPLQYLDSITDWPWPWVLKHAVDAFFGVIGMNLGVVAVVGGVAWMSRRAGRPAPGPAGSAAPRG